MLRKAFIIILSFVICFVAGQALISIIGSVTKFNIVENIQNIRLEMTKEINILKLIQAISSFFTFILPSFVITKLLEHNTVGVLKLNRSPQLAYYILAYFFMIAAMPLMNLIIEWNNNITFPSWMSGIEGYMRSSEDANMHITKIMLSGNTYSVLLINLIIIALIPALGEELLFRGIMQKYLNDWIKNPHIAILITGIIFSAIHFQFYGFVPRLLLGIFFGYLVYFSGSLWPAIFAHFANNGMAVLVQFLINKGTINDDIGTLGAKLTDIYYLIIGVAIAVFIGKYLFRKYSER
jgi:membrane protease YdiL (CAAX protease family)